jgi:hypothetical protein
VVLWCLRWTWEKERATLVLLDEDNVDRGSLLSIVLYAQGRNSRNLSWLLWPTFGEHDDDR